MKMKRCCAVCGAKQEGGEVEGLERECTGGNDNIEGTLSTYLLLKDISL